LAERPFDDRLDCVPASARQAAGDAGHVYGCVPGFGLGGKGGLSPIRVIRVIRGQPLLRPQGNAAIGDLSCAHFLRMPNGFDEALPNADCRMPNEGGGGFSNRQSAIANRQ
ncbi:MAG TPA: hypothetical protein VK797_28505, partial [Tepidisphaeraceae bacterium]|nr:hypothetical protein [Tepidisphaeraceae bacterium]